MSNALSTGCRFGFGRSGALLSAPEAAEAVAIIASMPLEQLLDEELVAQYRAAASLQDRDQFVNELFRRNYSRVARWCLRFTSDRETAADMAQEVFAKAYQNLTSFQGQSKFSTWLFVIARNHCLNVVRANARQASELKAEVDEGFFAALPDTGDGPDAALDRGSSAKAVAEMLDQALDETEKAVFKLHYGEEIPLDTITRLLGLENRSGAKAYIVSAKRKLARFVPRWKAGGKYTEV